MTSHETASGRDPENPRSASTPTSEKRSDGQYKDHWVLPASERDKGFVRPVRLEYKHVGPPGPQSVLIDLAESEIEHYKQYGYIKFEKYLKNHHAVGRYWTQEQIDRVGSGCNTVTTMPQDCAETYARQPGFYGSTFCVNCGEYFPVGESGEFIWLDDETRVGT